MWGRPHRKPCKCSFSGKGITDGKFLQSSMATSTEQQEPVLRLHCASILTVRSNCLHDQLGSALPTGVPGGNGSGAGAGALQESQSHLGSQCMDFSCSAVRKKERGQWVWVSVCCLWDCIYVVCILCVVHDMTDVGYGLYVVYGVCWVYIWCLCMVFMLVRY